MMLLYGALSHALRFKEFGKSWWLTVKHQKFYALCRNDLGGAAGLQAVSLASASINSQHQSPFTFASLLYLQGMVPYDHFLFLDEPTYSKSLPPVKPKQ